MDIICLLIGLGILALMGLYAAGLERLRWAPPTWSAWSWRWASPPTCLPPCSSRSAS